MTQPEFVPVVNGERARDVEHLPPPDSWIPDRPAEIDIKQPSGPLFGVAGPDQGYALKLALGFVDSFELARGESSEDAIAGCLGVALRRAARYGRAPVVYDLELAFTIWGFLGGAPKDLVEYRLPLFQACSHHYAAQRKIVDLVNAETLELTPDQAREQMSDWRNLISA